MLFVIANIYNQYKSCTLEPGKDNQNNAYYFLQGGGQMGGLTRGFNWHQTAVGPPSQWPQSLQSVVSLILSSKFPMFLWWGEDLIQFYNDAYRPSLGNNGKHPQALGQKGKDCWPEIWDIIHPLIQQVLTTGEATWSEDQLVPIYRNNKIEDVYWTFGYSPVRNETGNVEGVLVICTETTDKVVNLKKLEAANQQFTSLVMHAPVAIAVFRGDDFIAETINDAYLPLVGKTREEFVGKALFESLPETRDVLEPIARELVRTGVQYSASEFELLIKRNGRDELCYFNSVWEPLREHDGRVNGFIVVAHEITEHVVARKKLEESETRYRTLIEEGTVATALYTGPEIRIQYANDTMIRYWGKDRSVIGKTFREILPELEDQPFPRLLETVYVTGATYTGKEEKADIVVDGKLQSFYFNFTYKALRNAEAEVYGIYHAAIDVTEQVLTRKKAEESGHQVRSLVESAPFPIGVFTGKEMRITLANKAITDAWGKGSDVIGKLYTDILPELENQAVFDQLNSVFTTGNAFHARNQRIDIHTNGKLQPFYFNYSFVPLYDAAGRVYGVMNTAADVTDLNLAKQKIEQSEKNFRSIILQAPVAMCILMGPLHVVEVANEMMIELWGKPVHAVMHKPIFEGLPDARYQGLEELMDNVFNTGDTFKAYERPINLFRNGRFETVYQNFVYEAYKDADGTILGVLAIAIDITHQVLARRKIEEVVADRTRELAETNGKLQKSNAELAQFAYIASHDLQEPVRKVTTFANMLEHSLGDIDERSNRYLDKIKESSSRMHTLIKDVLTYSQLSKEKEVFETVNLQQVIENIKTDFELLIEQKEATIQYTELPTIEAIPLQMAQLFGNLISNSLKFSRAYVQPVITITAQQMMRAKDSATSANTDYYNIEIRDNGIGFHPKHAEQVFNIFQRLHGRQEYAGTGIGLAMCKKIAQNHHGDIYAAASTESGAVFNILLPCKQTN